MLEAASPALREAAAEVGRAPEPVGSREARRRRQEPPCFDGSDTVSRFRPFFRLRDSTARPHREAMRARNPCLLIRRLLRGLYDGFMNAPLQSEPGKLVKRMGEIKLAEAEPRQLDRGGAGVTPSDAEGGERPPWLLRFTPLHPVKARIDFSTPDP